MKFPSRALLRVTSVPVLTVTLICGFAYFAPGNSLRTVAAQSMSPSGSFGFLINATFVPASNKQGTAILGVMNFDGAGNVTGSYTYEVGAGTPNVPQTRTGTFTGTYSSNPDGTGSATIALDAGITVGLNMLIAESGRSLQLVATNCSGGGCDLVGTSFSGIARAGQAGSLNGSYGFQFNNSPYAGGSLGVAKFDGAGNVSVSLTFIGAGDSNGVTSVFMGTQTGTYSINPDGSGTLNFPAVPGQSQSQTYAFVVTDGGSALLVLQTDRSGNGVSFGPARLQ